MDLEKMYREMAEAQDKHALGERLCSEGFALKRRATETLDKLEEAFRSHRAVKVLALREMDTEALGEAVGPNVAKAVNKVFQLGNA